MTKIKNPFEAAIARDRAYERYEQREPDVTPETHPDHDVVGHEFGGGAWSEEKGYKAMRWFCYSHDAEGYNMYATDGSGYWTNVSERAIGASFHRIYKYDGRLCCSWFTNGKVPGYVP